MDNIAVNEWRSKNTDETMKSSRLNAEDNERQLNKGLKIKSRPH